MLTAINSKGKEIKAYNQSKSQLEVIRQQPLYCPECHQKVILKAGPVMIPHFAHYKNSTCPNQGESQTHLKGKINLYNWCIKQGFYAKLEHVIPSIKQRLDVLVKIANRWVAIEYQCSPISLDELQKRTYGIASKGIIPLWVFGPNYYNTKMGQLFWNTTLRASVMYNQRAKQDQLYFYDPGNDIFTIAAHFYSQRAKAITQLSRHSLKHMRWKDLFRTVQISHKYLYYKWLREKRLFRSGQRWFQAKYDEEFLKQLYMQHLHPQNLPSCIHLPVSNSYRFLAPNYVWQTQIVLYLTQLTREDTFYWNDLTAITQKYFKDRIVAIYPSQSIHPLTHYLDLLSCLGYITKKGKGAYRKARDFNFHRTLDTALKEDQEIIEKLLRF
ncbi:competence protein CoiA [Piscibacillus halophilus]|uniref:competence protein CoiA n=1 Tax=Piscibacillus halophilus TaxID=571933 RepID=UPI002409F120|nr:competence protein CoiA family protein [Piscibacillus halophilus]